jgi:hypothetical protein
MPGLQHKDFGYGTINSTIGAGDSRVGMAVNLSAGHGARLPTIDAAQGEFFYVDFINSSGYRERFLCTARTADALTLRGAMCGTTAKAFAPADRFEIVMCAGHHLDYADLFGLKLVAVAGGTSDALTATVKSAIGALVHGMRLTVISAAANTLTNPTLTVTFDATSIGGTTVATAAKTIVKGNDLPLSVWDIPGSGYPLDLIYNSTYGKYVLLNPARGIYITPERSVRGLVAVNNAGAPASQMDITWDEVIVQDANGRTVNVGGSGGTITLDINDSQSGPEANKRDGTGTFAASATINVFAIYNGTTKAVIASTASRTTGPALPTGYDYWAYLTTFVLDGSSQFYTVYCYGDKVFYQAKKQIASSLANTSRTAITVTAYVPTSAKEFAISGTCYLNTGGTSHNNILSFYVVDSATIYASPLQQVREGAGANTSSGGAISLVVPNTGYFGYGNNNNGQSAADLSVNWYSVHNGG